MPACADRLVDLASAGAQVFVVEDVKRGAKLARERRCITSTDFEMVDGVCTRSQRENLWATATRAGGRRRSESTG